MGGWVLQDRESAMYQLGANNAYDVVLACYGIREQPDWNY
jgi:hypothetical protein